MAVISKGITLSYKNGASEFVLLKDLQEIPDLGGEADAIEITTLEDTAHTYTDGLLNYGDNLPFKFLYKKEQFSTLVALEGESEWKVSLPDGETCTWKGTSSVKLDGVGTNGAITYTLAVKPSTEMAWA